MKYAGLRNRLQALSSTILSCKACGKPLTCSSCQPAARSDLAHLTDAELDARILDLERELGIRPGK